MKWLFSIISLFVVMVTLSTNVESVTMAQGSMGLGWQGCPNIRYWISPKMAIQPAVDLNLQSSNASGVSLQNTMFISCKVLMPYKERKDYNLNIGAGIDLTTITNLNNKSGDSSTIIDIYGLVDIEYFFRFIPDVSVGTNIGVGLTNTTTNIGGNSVTVNTIGFQAAGFALNTISSLNLRYYFK